MKFECENGDVDYIDQAPLQFINSVELQATPEAVFASLADTEAWLKWFPDMTAAVWEGEPGAGTDRVVKVGPMQIREHFIIWNAPYQMAFYVSETTLPFAKRMVENYTIEETENGSRFTYAVGMQFRFPLSMVKFAAKPKFEKMFRDAVASFGEYVNAR
jgi:ribosome-associated toxin RatA of RatAB toxin-antitoxin module